MSHGPEHQIEHAEHAVHASHSDYDKRVTISIAIIAAVLACVTMLGHRAHNDTLQLKTLAARQSTEASNKWNYYQTKNLFHLEATLMLDQMRLFESRGASPDDVEKARAKYAAEVEKYDRKLPEIMKEAQEIAAKGDEYLEQSHHVHARANRFDYGELALQLAVVLCSLAILTKSRGFWYAGIVSAVIGAAIALTGVFDLFLAFHH
jgi:hypothetical protein